MIEDKPIEFEIEVYSCNGQISDIGYSPSNKRMVYFDYGNCGYSIRGRSDLLARIIASDLKDKLRKNSGVQKIKFSFPQSRKSISHYADGFFGRPVICTGATLLKPLPKRRKNALVKEMNKISEIEDRWRNTIKLIA